MSESSSKLSAVIAALPSMQRSMVLDMGKLDTTDKHVLSERHLISVDQSEKGAGSGVVVREDESVSIMVNEEDHLRIQVMSPGSNIQDVWQQINEVDSELEKNVSYAFSRRLGYLTACPSNVGTGLRASLMLHLAGLNLLNEVEQVVNGLTKIGLAVRGLLGEGTEASGNMFQISNQTTLGESEEQITRRLGRIALEVADHEHNARVRLMNDREVYVRDYVGRAVGVMLNVHLLSSHEMLNLLSAIKLGVDLGLVQNVDKTGISELMLLTQPGHMQRMQAKELSPEERDEARAAVVRSKLKRMSI